MTCQGVENNLSLYLYGELDFAGEEAFEQHLADCAGCRRALEREKGWHSSANSGQEGVPLDLLANCRRNLRESLSRMPASAPGMPFWRQWVIPSAWQMRLAAMSFLVILGFGAGRWMDRGGMNGLTQWAGNGTEMGLLTPYSRIREIRPADSGRVRIIVDQIHQQEIVGGLQDQNVRRALLAATQDPNDPAIRVDSVEMLSGQAGTDIRDALLSSVRRDPNPAVRLKALEGLRRFTSDSATRQTLKQVLEHDGNAGVRSEAIDVLAPTTQHVDFSPDLASTLQELIRYQQSDEYVRMRCWRALQEMKADPDVY